MIIKRILALLIGVPIGFAIIKYREKVYQWTGSIGFAEKYLGNGGTFTLILIVGALVVAGSILYFTGAHTILLEKLVGSLKF